MHPILLRVGDFEIHTFGLMMVMAWLSAGFYLEFQFRRLVGLPRARDAVSDILVWILAGSLIGARMLYLAVEYPSWVGHFWQALFSRSGLVFYGGFFGGVIGGVWALRRQSIAVRLATDAIAPAAALGLAIGRIGCFLAGDDYGLPSSAPWAVTFMDPDSLAPLGVPLHPAQIYLALNALAIFFVLHVQLTRKRFDGQGFALLLILYSITRFGLEFFRGDPRGHVGPLSTSQFISLLVLPTGLGLYYFWSRRVPKTPS